MASLSATTIQIVKEPGFGEVELTSGKLDGYLQGTIDAVSTEIEQYLGTKLLLVSVVETRNVYRFLDSIWLRRTPVVSVATVETRTSLATAWVDATTLDATSYDFDPVTGELMIQTSYLGIGPRTLRVTYTAGFSATTAALLTAYPDIVHAANVQVAHELRRRQSLEKLSVSVDGGTQSVEAVRLLATVKDKLKAYKRFAV